MHPKKIDPPRFLTIYDLKHLNNGGDEGAFLPNAKKCKYTLKCGWLLT
jgi:hypothetical protein